MARGDALALEPSRRSGPMLVDGQHPVGVEQRPRGSGDHLRPADAVRSDIRLYAGRVGCGSCHSVFARRDRLLVLDNHGSTLCLGCHDM
jgi:predicted CXXCH cytochrome family protein